MRKLLLFICLIFLFINSNCKNIKSKEIKESDCSILTHNFPSTFEGFNKSYGFDDDKGEGELYSEYVNHIESFFKCENISISGKLNKSFSIAVNGKWDADAVGMFQEKLWEFIEDNPKEALEILNDKTEKNASSIWYFLLDGPHPKNWTNVDRIKTLSDLFGKDNPQTIILKNQYKNIISKSDH